MCGLAAMYVSQLEGRSAPFPPLATELHVSSVPSVAESGSSKSSLMSKA
jgi:hypothetical protein